MTKKRITILLGAGAAIPWGAPTTSAITQFLRKDTNFKSKSGDGIYEYFYQKLTQQTNVTSDINFEKIISAVEHILEFYTTSVRTHQNTGPFNLQLFNDLKCWVNEVEDFLCWEDDTSYIYRTTSSGDKPLSKEYFPNEDFIKFYYWYEVYEYAIGTIVCSLSNYIDGIDNEDNKDLNNSLKSLIDYLHDKEYVVRVYTTNYDLLLPYATKLDIFDGFSNIFETTSGTFNPHFSEAIDKGLNEPTKKYPTRNFCSSNYKILTDKNCLCYYNLHGCVYWDFKTSMEDFEYHFERNGYIHPIIFDFNEKYPNPQQPIHLSNIITGLNKIQRVTVNPLNAFHAAFQEDCIKADHIITVGYSFSDPHINSALFNGIKNDETYFTHVDCIEQDDVHDNPIIPKLNNIEPNKNEFKKELEIDENGFLTSEKETSFVFTKGFKEYIKKKLYKKNV